MYTVIEFIKDDPAAIIPKYSTPGSAGLDLHSVTKLTIPPGHRFLIDTGLKIALEHGYEAQIRSRSGMAYKAGVVVLNSPGTIDSDYRGTVGVLLINHGKYDYEVSPGDKVAQLVVKPVCQQVRIKTVEQFSDPETERGDGGFGSTGR